MKRFLLIIVSIIMLFQNLTVLATDDISLYLDGKEVLCNPAPVIINDRTMVPARVVFEEIGAKVSWNAEKRKVGIAYNNINIEMIIGEAKATVNGKTLSLDSPCVIKNDRTLIPLRFVGEAIGASVTWVGEERKVLIETKEKIPPVIIGAIEFSHKTDYDCVTMTSSGKASVKTMTLKDPVRMVIDIQNASLSVLNKSFEGKAVSQVRYGEHDGYVRFVAESCSLPGYFIFDNEGVTELRFYKDKKAFDYIGMKEYLLIFESNVKFSAKKGNKVTFISGKKLDKEDIKINDELIESVSVSGTKIEITLKKDADYSITGNTIEFTIKEKEEEEVITKSGIVVLDAGHGGKDPGTLGYDEDGKTILANEKDMNLTITLMVYEILKSNGVKVVLTRKDDTYVGLLDRARMANKQNAELFVSIHNNSIPNPDYKGSMVLYSLDSPGGKKLASNILREMTKSANTENKGLRDGTNMAVIRNTVMPAVIVECGCLTNREELENLMDIDFLHSLAIGIAEGILITLGK